MGKTGVDKKEWDSVVSKAEGSISSIEKFSPKKMDKTTLSKVKKIEELQTTLSETITSYKELSVTNTTKMKSVAEKIVSEDKEFAGMIDQNTANVRFK